MASLFRQMGLTDYTEEDLAGDDYESFMIGVDNAAAGLSSFASQMATRMGAEFPAAKLDEWATAFRKDASDAFMQLSPKRQRDVTQPFSEADDLLGSFVAKSFLSLPSMIGTTAAGVIGGAIGGPVGAGLGVSAMSGALTGGETVSQVHAAIDQLGLSPGASAAAKEKAFSTGADLWAGAAGAVAGLAGPEAILTMAPVRKLIGAATGRVTGAVTGAAVSGAGEAIEGAIPPATTNMASAAAPELGIPEQSVVEGAIEEGVLGLGIGGGVSAVTGVGKQYTVKPPGELDVDETAALDGIEIPPPGQLALPPPGGPIMQPGATTAPLALPPPTPRDVRGGRVTTPDVMQQPGATTQPLQLEAPGTVPSATRAPGVIPLGNEAVPDAAPGADPLVQPIAARKALIDAGFQPEEIDAWDHDEALEALVSVAREMMEQNGTLTPVEIEDMVTEFRRQAEASVAPGPGEAGVLDAGDISVPGSGGERIAVPSTVPGQPGGTAVPTSPESLRVVPTQSNPEVITAPVAEEAIPTEQPLVAPLPVAPTAAAKPAPVAEPVIIPGTNAEYEIRPVASGFELVTRRNDGLQQTEGPFKTQDSALDWIEQKEAQAAPAPEEEAIPTVEALPEPQGAPPARPTRVSAPPLAAETEVSETAPIPTRESLRVIPTGRSEAVEPEAPEPTPSEIFSPEETTRLSPEAQARYDRIQAAAAEQEAAQQEAAAPKAAPAPLPPLSTRNEVAPERLAAVETIPIGERGGARILRAAPTRAEEEQEAEALAAQTTEEKDRRAALIKKYPDHPLAKRTDLNTAQITKLIEVDPKKAATLIEANPPEEETPDAVSTVMRLEGILAQAANDDIAYPGSPTNPKGRVSKHTADHIVWLADMARTVKALSKDPNNTNALLQYQANEALARDGKFDSMRASFGSTSAGRSGGVGTGGVDIEQVSGGMQAYDAEEAARREEAGTFATADDTTATRPESMEPEARPAKSASKPVVAERTYETAPVRKVEITPETAARALAAMQAAEAKSAPKTGPKTPPKPKSPQSEKAAQPTDASEREPHPLWKAWIERAENNARRQVEQNARLAHKAGMLNFKGNWVEPVHDMTLSDAIHDLDLDNPRAWLGAHNQLVRRILQLMQKTHADLQVYVLKAEDIETARGNEPSERTNVDGFYARMHPNNMLGKEFIVIREDEWNKTDRAYKLLAHEGIHPLTIHMLDQHPALGKALESLIREIQALHDVYPQGVAFAPTERSFYGLTSAREMLAEITNPRFADLLHSTPISRALAKQLGLEGWRKATAWNGIVAAVRKYFNLMLEKIGFPPINDFNAFEVVLSTIERGSLQFDAEGLATYQAKGLEQGLYHGDQDYLMAEVGFEKARKAAREVETLRKAFYSKPTDAHAQVIDAKLSDQFTLAAARNVAQSSGSTLKGRLRNTVLYFRSMDSIMRGYEHLFQPGTLRRYVNAILRRFTLSKELNALDANLMREKAALLDKYAGKTIHGVSAQEVYENSLHDQSNWNVDASVPLAQNKWLHDKNGTIPLRNRAATSKHAALAKQYNSLPADMKTFMQKEFKFYKDKQARIMDGILTNTVMAAAGGKLGKAASLALGKRVADGTATQGDIDTIGRAAAARISKADFKVQHGPYVPQLRFGDYVVNAVVKIADPVVGKWNRVKSPQSYIVDFHGPRAEADATRFANNREEYAEIKRVWTINGKATDPQGNPFSQKDVINGAVESYRVTIQNRHVEFFETEGEAKAAAEELKGDKYYESVAPANVREQTGESFGQEGASARALQAIVDELAKTDDALGALPSHVKANMKQAMQQAVYRAAPGTSISKRRLKRKHIAGASKDSLRVMHSYSIQTNNYIAGVETAHELSEAYKPLKAMADTNYSGVEMTPQAVLNELSSRRNSQAAEQSSPLVNTLTTVQFVDKLASPAYSVINMMQMPMVTLPELSKIHGVANSSRALSRAMGKIGLGQITKAGAADTQKAFMARLEKATSYHDLITKNNPGVTKREAAMLDKLVEYGSLDPDSGFEASRGTSGGKLLHWVEETWRQAPRAIEAMNRYGTALAAYELSMKKHGDHAKAVEYARDMVDSTQFNYSAANSSPIFNHPVGRVAFQFMKFGANMYQLMGANTVNLFSKHSTKEERIAAAKGLTYLIGAHVIMAGFGGLPLEPARLMVTALGAAGIDIDWERDVEFAVREVLAEAVGPTMAEIMAKGLPRYVFNADISQRVGLGDLLVARPQLDLDERGGLASYLVQMVGGATVGSGLDLFNGAQDIAEGKVMQGVGKVIPLKVFGDIETAVRYGNTGKVSEAGDPVLTYGPLDILTRGLGFRPATEANVSERRGATADRTQAIRDEDTAIKQTAHAGGYTPSQLAAAIRAANADRPRSLWITADEVREFSTTKTKNYKKNIGTVIPHGNVDVIKEIMQTIPD